MTAVLIILGGLGWALYAIQFFGNKVFRKIWKREVRQIALLYIATMAVPEAYEQHRLGLLATMTEHPSPAPAEVTLDALVDGMRAPDPDSLALHEDIALEFLRNPY